MQRFRFENRSDWEVHEEFLDNLESTHRPQVMIMANYPVLRSKSLGWIINNLPTVVIGWLVDRAHHAVLVYDYEDLGNGTAIFWVNDTWGTQMPNGIVYGTRERSFSPFSGWGFVEFEFIPESLMDLNSTFTNWSRYPKPGEGGGGSW
jgi:hypothetical protein